MQLAAGLAWHRKGSYVYKDAVVRVCYSPIYHQQIINSADLKKYIFSFNRGEKYTKLYLCIFIYLFQLSIVSACCPLSRVPTCFIWKTGLLMSQCHKHIIRAQISSLPRATVLGVIDPSNTLRTQETCHRCRHFSALWWVRKVCLGTNKHCPGPFCSLLLAFWEVFLVFHQVCGNWSDGRTGS